MGRFYSNQMEIEKIIDYVIDNKSDLSKKLQIWNEQKFKVKTNDEYSLISKRIEIGEAILNAL